MPRADDLIGVAMRLYRRSPLWPHAGKYLAALLARFSPRGKRVQKTIDGLTYELDLNEVIDSSLYYAGSFEKNLEDLMDALVKPGMTVLDIGANVGCHTVRFARNVSPAGRVIAVEPTAAAGRRLRRNVELNGFRNVQIHPVGLSDREEGLRQVSFQSSYPLNGRLVVVEETVRLTSLDLLLEENAVTGVSFIKLDVDGHEEAVIRGALQTLRRDAPTLVVEVTPPPDPGAPCAVLAILEGLGYSFRDELRRPVPHASASPAWHNGRSPINLLALPAGKSI